MPFEKEELTTLLSGLTDTVLGLAWDDPLVVIAPRRIGSELFQDALCADERERLGRFRFHDDRERFLAAHALKRRLLAALLDCPAEGLRFASGQGEKPRLAGGGPDFNLSHSGDWVALIVAGNTPVGIDVEQPSETTDCGQLASQVFHPEDRFQPEPMSPQERFYTAWTLKEAVSKGIGLGLALPFPELRLWPVGRGCYCCMYQGAPWHALHWRIGEGAHIAMACGSPWNCARVLRVESAGRGGIVDLS
jgi:4'-phosphopantetheinyl transferase